MSGSPPRRSGCGGRVPLTARAAAAALGWGASGPGRAGVRQAAGGGPWLGWAGSGPPVPVNLPRGHGGQRTLGLHN